MTDQETRVREARSRITEISPRDAMAQREREPDTLFLDVREQNEWNLFHLPGAVHLPLGKVPDEAPAVVPMDRPVVVYCGAGGRSALAADELQRLGYRRVSSMAGGIRGWSDAGGDLEM